MVHTCLARVVAAQDIDHVAIRVGVEPSLIAGVVVAELARGHGLIFDHFAAQRYALPGCTKNGTVAERPDLVKPDLQ